MSWLSIPLPNPLKSLHSDVSQSHESPPSSSLQSSDGQHASSPVAGVKEDFSVLSLTIGRQLRGVAAFLAPPPEMASPASAAESSDVDASDSSSLSLLGIRNDLVEIGGSFKSGLSLLSSNKAVSGISKIASNLLQFGEEGDGHKDETFGDDHSGFCDAPGITDDVLNFVEEISTRPECWMDFPLSLKLDFNMSDTQKEHASTVLQLSPSFTALKLKLSSYMSDKNFWMIYFILLLPRLDVHGSELLSTSEIVEAREILLQNLKNKSYAQVESNENKTAIASADGDQHRDRDRQGESSPSQGKKILADTINAMREIHIEEHESTDQWLKEGGIDRSTSVSARKPLEEDMSFSDLEDDDDDLSRRLSGSRPGENIRSPSPNGSSEWVQLNDNSKTQGGCQKASPSSHDRDSEGEESNDWLTIDDFDSDSSAAV
ncbi:uncharacterized protein LOC131157842 [Malania oleifera]|uniref:uncharacterized protein LOC131157842 n=1 Tax=Malania oleifera TaxID=397392 RepID=UPI0025AE5511|nr:uncharacterized protein LOC131157842 [Malania oleifera]